MHLPTSSAPTALGSYNAGVLKEPMPGSSTSVSVNSFGDMMHTDIADVIPTGETTVICQGGVIGYSTRSHQRAIHMHTCRGSNAAE
jgi:hypothetical protein